MKLNNLQNSVDENHISPQIPQGKKLGPLLLIVGISIIFVVLIAIGLIGALNNGERIPSDNDNEDRATEYEESTDSAKTNSEIEELKLLHYDLDSQIKELENSLEEINNYQQEDDNMPNL